MKFEIGEIVIISFPPNHKFSRYNGMEAEIVSMNHYFIEDGRDRHRIFASWLVGQIINGKTADDGMVYISPNYLRKRPNPPDWNLISKPIEWEMVES